MFQTINSSAIMTSAPKERASVVNAIRTTALSFGNGIGLALTMALIVAFVSASDAGAFMAGNPAGLSADGRTGIDLGFGGHLHGDAGAHAARPGADLGPARSVRGVPDRSLTRRLVGYIFGTPDSKRARSRLDAIG